jgi:hypothetical protein
MATLDDVSRIADGLPGSEEKPSGGGLAWFVRRKPFAWEVMPWPSHEVHVRAIVAAEPCLGVTLADEEEKLALVQMRPDVFVASQTKWGGLKIILRLRGIDTEHLTELVTESWRLQAPQYLRRELDER